MNIAVHLRRLERFSRTYSEYLSGRREDPQSQRGPRRAGGAEAKD